MLNGHEPTDSKHVVPPTDGPVSTSESKPAPKPSRTSALRNRLSLRRHDGSPKDASRTVSAQSRARDQRTASGQSGGFLLDSPRNKAVTSEASHRVKSVEYRAGHGEYEGLQRRVQPSSRLSGAFDGQVLRTSTSSRGDYADAPRLSADLSARQPSQNGTSDRHVDNVQNTISPSGLSNNPAEIVDLALNLSARRRRSQFGQLPLSDNPLSRSRLSSHNMGLFRPTPAESTDGATMSGSVQPPPNMNGHTIENGSKPISEADTLAEQSQVPIDIHVDGLYGVIPIGGVQPSILSGGMTPSQATLKRVEKAKAILESAYHHRRLLQHLPELPRPSAAPNRRDEAQQILEDSHSLRPGRRYNPLQYIRNRRIRQREGCPLDPSKGGWEEIENIRSWVDAVAQENSRDPVVARSMRSLPPVTADAASPSRKLPSFANTSSQLDLAPSQKASRSRADWAASPAELLADVHWTHESNNKFRLVDRKGNRLFEAPQPIAQDNHGIPENSGSEPVRGGKERISLDVPRPLSRDSSIREGSISDRGRRRYHDRSLGLSAPPIRSSLERYGRIPRSILRSTSPSARSEGSDAAGPSLGRGLQSVDDKDMPDVMLLRQQLRMLSRSSTRRDNAEATNHERTDSAQRGYADLDAVSVSSAAEAIGQPRRRPREDPPRSRRPPDTSEFHALDLALSSDHENMNQPSRFSNPPYIFINSEVSSQPRARLRSPFRSEAKSANDRAHSRGASMEVGEAESELDSTNKSTQQGEGIGSQLNHSPSPSPLRTRDTIKNSPTFVPTELPRPRHLRRESESRLRGLIRSSSKLTELITTPVVKVGDLLWRRTELDRRARSSSRSSPERNKTSHKDATDDIEEVAPDAEMSDCASSRNGRGHNHPYHIENLPVFRSPFKGSNAGSIEDGFDHITRQQEAVRHRRSSSRFDKLAPPSLDMRSITGSPTRPSTPADSKKEGLGEYRQRGSNSRRSAVVDGGFSDSPEFQRDTRGASQDPTDPQLGRWRPGSYTFAMAKLDAIGSTGKVTKRDVSRLAALMTSCAIHSRSATRWAVANCSDPSHAWNSQSPAHSLNSGGISPQKAPRLSSGKNLVHSINQTFTSTRDAVGTFSEGTVNDLHKQVQSLHKELSDDLTGAVRKAERSADELGSQLAADFTLEVKRLTEVVDVIMRRRRRRARWLTRIGFSLLEWTVLAAMWWVWLVVVLYRLLKGSVKAVFWAVRWLLWL